MKKPSGVGGAPSAGRASGGGRGIMAEVRESSKREIEALGLLGDGTDTTNKHLAEMKEILGNLERGRGPGGGRRGPIVPGQGRAATMQTTGGAKVETTESEIGDKIKRMADSIGNLARPKVLHALEKGTVPATTQARENRQLLYAAQSEEHLRKLVDFLTHGGAGLLFGPLGGGVARIRVE
jgi:hypothetical protein